MKPIGISIILAFVFLLTACVPSLNPLYTEQDLVFDKSILGVWTDDKQTETWEFVYVDEKEYKLVHTDEDGYAYRHGDGNSDIPYSKCRCLDRWITDREPSAGTGSSHAR